MGTHFQRARRNHTSQYNRQLRATLAKSSAEMVISRSTSHPDWRRCTLIPPRIRQRRNPSHRRRNLNSILPPNRWQRKHPPICPHPSTLPVNPSHSPYPDQILTPPSFIRNSCAQKLGFSNAELLQDTDWDKVKIDPRRAAPKLPKWVWSHDPEAYAYENYDKAAQSLQEGIDMKDEDKFEPNYPKGYKYEPWSIEKIMEDMRAGKPIDLGPGDWE